MRKQNKVEGWTQKQDKSVGKVCREEDVRLENNGAADEARDGDALI